MNKTFINFIIMIIISIIVNIIAGTFLFIVMFFELLYNILRFDFKSAKKTFYAIANLGKVMIDYRSYTRF
jgi:hypothetical protein